METSIFGLDNDELLKKRNETLTFYDSLSKEGLESHLKGIEKLIVHRENTEEAGTSELNWQRIVILQKLND